MSELEERRCIVPEPRPHPRAADDGRDRLDHDLARVERVLAEEGVDPPRDGQGTQQAEAVRNHPLGGGRGLHQGRISSDVFE
jgi:hypothetical protein